MSDERFIKLETLGVVVDPQRREVKLGDGSVASLTPREWQVYKAKLAGANTGREIIEHLTEIEKVEGTLLTDDLPAISPSNLHRIESELAKKIGRGDVLKYRLKRSNSK